MSRRNLLGLASFLLLLLMVTLGKNDNVIAIEESQIFPKYITKVTWLNNNEILISDCENWEKKNSRLIKYIISKNSYLPIINKDFAQKLAIGFSKDGRTIFTFDYCSKDATIKRDNKIIYQKNLNELMLRISKNERKERGNFNLTIGPIRVLDNCAIIGIRTDAAYKTIAFNCPADKFIGGIGIIEDYAPIPQVHDPSSDIYYFYSQRPQGISKYEIKQKKHSFLFPGKNVNLGGQIREYNGYIYVTQFQLSPIFELYDEPIIKGNCLYRYGIKEELLKKQVEYFDISKNFLVTSSVNYYSNSLEYLSVKKEAKAFISVFYEHNRLVWTKRIDNFIGLGPFNLDFLPLISPDEKIIVILICYTPKDPIVIDTKDLIPHR